MVTISQNQKEQSEKAKAEKIEKEKKRNQEERELVKQGKTPFYLKQCKHCLVSASALFAQP